MALAAPLEQGAADAELPSLEGQQVDALDQQVAAQARRGDHGLAEIGGDRRQMFAGKQRDLAPAVGSAPVVIAGDATARHQFDFGHLHHRCTTLGPHADPAEPARPHRGVQQPTQGGLFPHIVCVVLSPDSAPAR